MNKSLLPFLSLLKFPSNEGLEDYSLQNFKPWESLFTLKPPLYSTYKKGRQVGASTNISAYGALLCSLVANLKLIYVSLQYEHAMKLSKIRLQPFLDNSPFIQYQRLSGQNVIDNIFNTVFNNNSSIDISYILKNPDRVRGLSGDILFVDECQDMLHENVEVAEACLSQSNYHLVRYTGTPKTTTNFLEEKWGQSSQAEWFCYCDCGYWNIPGLEYDLMDMLGEKGPICAKCGKLINPDRKENHWVHGIPERIGKHNGYHFPQIILPTHYAIPLKWQILMDRYKNWGEAEFLNEVLGEPCDTGTVPITAAELRRACIIKPEEEWTFDRAKKYGKRFRHKVMGLDVGGKGENEVSKTAYAIIGKNEGGEYECVWGHVFPTSKPMEDEAKEVGEAFRAFGCQRLCYDFLMGPGFEALLKTQGGIPGNKLVPVCNASHPKKGVILLNTQAARTHFTLDKTRALLIVMQAIKNVKLIFPTWSLFEPLLSHFLALRIEHSSSIITERILIGRAPEQSDDFAQAISYGLHPLAYKLAKINGNMQSEYNYILNGVNPKVENLLS